MWSSAASPFARLGLLSRLCCELPELSVDGHDGGFGGVCMGNHSVSGCTGGCCCDGGVTIGGGCTTGGKLGGPGGSSFPPGKSSMSSAMVEFIGELDTAGAGGGRRRPRR